MRLSARSIAEFGERHYGGPELEDSSTCQTHRPITSRSPSYDHPFSTRRCLTCGRSRVSHAHSAPYVDNGHLPLEPHLPRIAANLTEDSGGVAREFTLMSPSMPSRFPLRTGTR